MKTVELSADVLVVGGGIAGLFAAIAARREGADVVLLSKSTAGRGGESIMAAGVYLCFEEQDDLTEWVQESIEVSDGMDDPLLVGRCIFVSRFLLRLMDQWGVDWEKQGNRFVTKPGLGMKKMRNAMFNDARQLMWILRAKALELGTKIFDRVMVLDLLTSDGKAPTEGRVVGAVGCGVRREELYIVKAKAVVLAAGPWGINQFHPMDVTGDGEAMALRVGARMRSMEQLCFSLAPKVNFALPGLHALTGHGGRFVNAKGERYMEKYSPELLERSPRPVLVRAAAFEIQGGRGPVYLDLTHLSPEDYGRLERVVPHTIKALKAAGVDPAKDLIEYVPVLYGNGPMGGVMINEDCATNVPGLYCAGGTTDRMYAGVPGLTGASSTGFLAGLNAARAAGESSACEPAGGQVEQIVAKITRPLNQRNGFSPREVYYQAQRTVLDKIGVIKDPSLLEDGLHALEELEVQTGFVSARDLHELMNALEVQNIVQIARVVAAASLKRTESRYFHYRRDYPYRDDQNWSRWLICRLQPTGDLEFSDLPFRPLSAATEGLEELRNQLLWDAR